MVIVLFGMQMRDDADLDEYAARSRQMNELVRQMPGFISLTLRRGYSPTGSRFNAAGIPATPRRRCPRHTMFLAAFRSRSRMRPQVVQTWVRTRRLFRLLEMCSPHPLHSCEVYAGETASTRVPAHAAVQARIDRNCLHPASCMLLLRPAF